MQYTIKTVSPMYLFIFLHEELSFDVQRTITTYTSYTHVIYPSSLVY